MSDNKKSLNAFLCNLLTSSPDHSIILAVQVFFQYFAEPFGLLRLNAFYLQNFQITL